MAAANAKMAAAGGGPDQGKRRTRRVSGTKVRSLLWCPKTYGDIDGWTPGGIRDRRHHTPDQKSHLDK